MVCEVSETVDQPAVIIFSTQDGRDSKVERAHKFRSFEGTQKERCINRPHKISLQEAELWAVKTTDNVTIVPWVKQMVIGKLDLPKRWAMTEIVCVEPGKIHFEVLLIHAEFPELCNIRPFATIREETGSRSWSSGTQSAGVTLSLVNVMINNSRTARNQTLGTTLY
jgi:hypothetical protein